MHTPNLTRNCELLAHVPSQFSVKAHAGVGGIVVNVAASY